MNRNRLTPYSGPLARQPLGFLPTRRFWAGGEISLLRASLAAAGTGIAVFLVSVLAPIGASLLASGAWAGAITATSLLVGAGLLERLVRTRAGG